MLYKNSGLRWGRLLALFPVIAALLDAQNVLTYHNDFARTGLNPSETTLTPQNVNSLQFGKLFSIPVDGQVYAQPLYVNHVNIPGKGVHNVVFVATEHDSVYAFDADSNVGTNASPLWKTSFLGPGVSTLGPTDFMSCGSIFPEIGITSTPVIDPVSSTLYVVATTKESTGSVHRLHALDLSTGAEKFGGPVVIQGSLPGTGDGGSTITFDPGSQLQRTALLLLNGIVYFGFASHCDLGTYHGWMFGYNAQTLAQAGVFNVTPNGSEGSFWNSGAGAAADSSGFFYLSTGNGTFDANQAGSDYGNSVLRFGYAPSQGITVGSWFTPYNQDYLNQQDLDLGSAGVVVLPDETGSSSHPHLLVAAGKDGSVYLLDRASLGGFRSTDNSQIVQYLPQLVNSLFSTPAYFNHTLYYSGVSEPLQAFAIANGAINPTPSSQTASVYGFPGTVPSVSANSAVNNGAGTGIVWTLEGLNGGYGAAVLHAYAASNLNIELFNSTQNSARDALSGGYVKFSVPTVTGGKVYAGTLSTVDVFGSLSDTCGGASGFAINPTSVSLPVAGGSGTISVTAPAGCVWNAASGVTWASILSGSSGSGSGTVTFSVTANPGPQRSGTLTVAGQVFSVVQSGNNSATMSLGRSLLQFGVSTTGLTYSGPQDVSVTFSGSTSIFWSVSSDKAWLSALPTAGSGSGKFTVTLTPGSVPLSSSLQAHLTVSAIGVANSPQTITVNVSPVTANAAPFGVLDTPGDGSTGAGAIPVTGWALDAIGVTGVGIWRDPVASDPPAAIAGGPGPSTGLVYIGNAIFLSDTRPDVQAAYPGYPASNRSGWGMMFLTNLSPNPNGTAGVGGNGTFRLHAIATNQLGNQAEIGVHSITIDNTHATLPFGTIDTPTMGETVGGNYLNFAWVLTQQPKTIPTDGSTMFVSIDGGFSGRPAYGYPRADIATLFPGYNNTAGPVGYFYIDTTKLANGIHSVAWSVTDNANNNQGIGSRVFYVANSGNPGASEAPVNTAGTPSQPFTPARIRLRTGWRMDAPLRSAATQDGSFVIDLDPSDRLELQLGHIAGGLRAIQIAGDREMPLPGGSSFDAQRGLFTWAPLLGSRGEFHLRFHPEGDPASKVDVLVRVQTGTRRARE